MDEAMSGTNGVAEDGAMPTWVTQLNALTTAHKTPAAKSQDNMGSKAEGEATKKGTASGLSRKRPGTGRKLPSIPGLNDNSPVSSEHSSFTNDSSLDKVLPSGAGANGVAGAQPENGHSGTDLQARGVKFSPKLPRRNGDSSKSRLRSEDSPAGSDDSPPDSSRTGGVRNGSVRSHGSIDTQLLLKDTETVMAAMEARMGFRSDKADRDDDGSDTDLSSMVAMVNGDDDYVKPTKYHSPRESLTRKSSKDKDNSNIKIASRKPLVRSQSEQKPPVYGERSRGSAHSGAGVSVVSDVLSRNESLDESFQSDVSSDRGDTSFNRSGSRGKGTITMTKPNRAFALRRARADGTEVPEPSQNRRSSAASIVSSQSSSRRSSSSHSTGRAPYSAGQASGRSEATSLGAQIARKARENSGSAQSSNSRDSPMTRGEGGRGSLRSGRTTTPSSTASSSVSAASSAKKERDLRTLKSQLKTAPVNKDLAITGVSSRSQSQPGSRSNSPKAAERLAWKRRKEYDPRKAVAQAKAKAKEPKPKPKANSSLYKQRMTRSASFTNSVELSGRVRHDTYSMESTSSAEDLSSAATANDSYTEAGFRRAFIPFHNPLRSDRLSHSADEDESGTFPPSQDTASSFSKSSSQPPVSLMLKSAFTPPLSKLHTPSPDSPPPPGASLLLWRRTLGGTDYDDIGASTGGASSHRTQADSVQSYDSLIVSSIYQLSLKLKTTTDKTINKLREQDRVSITPSPIDDFLGHPAKSEIPAWKSANQELAGVLKNLRKMEHHLHVMERALFPDEDTDTDVSRMTSREKHKYFQEIERIRNELAGFQPIDTPRTESHDPGSPEMAELTQEF